VPLGRPGVRQLLKDQLDGRDGPRRV
jgi:hypothetical protein